MSALGQVEKLLTVMTRAEKAQVLQWVARDVGDALPGIVPTNRRSKTRSAITRTPEWRVCTQNLNTPASSSAHSTRTSSPKQSEFTRR